MYSNSSTKPISLLEAYTICFNEVSMIDPNAELSILTSTDKDDVINDNGENGKRRFWNVSFINNELKKEYSFSIKDGIVNDDKSNNKQKISKYAEKNNISKNLKLDSPEALEMAIDKYGISPGENWAIGYHFTIGIRENKKVLSVFGYDKNKNLSKINFDIETKEILDAEHKVAIDGGLYNGIKQIDLPVTNPAIVLGMYITPVTQNQYLTIWGIDNLKNNKPNNFLFISSNFGDEWQKIIAKDYTIKAWVSRDFNKDNKIYCITNTGIFSTINNGQTWENIENIKNNILSVNINKKSIFILTDKEIISMDIERQKSNIINIPPNPQDIIYSEIDENLYLLSQNEIFKYTNNEWSKILNNSEEVITGIVALDDNIIFYNTNKIIVYNIYSEAVYEISSLLNINKIFLVSNINNNIYVYSKENKIYKIIKGSDENKYELKLIRNHVENGLDLLISNDNDELLHYENPGIKTPDGIERWSFVVQDTGDVDWADFYAEKLTLHWVDIWCGADTTYNKNWAIFYLNKILHSSFIM